MAAVIKRLLFMLNRNEPVRWSFNSSLGVAVLVLGVLQLVAIPLQIAEPPRFSGFATIELGAKALPYIVGWMFIAVGGIYTLVGLTLREENELAGLSLRAIADIAIVVAVMISFVMMLRPLGFVTSSGISALVIALFFGSRNVFGLAFVGILAPTAIYLLFTRALSVSLPSSPFFPGF